MAYKVLFIDEEQEQHELFLDYMDTVADQGHPSKRKTSWWSNYSQRLAKQRPRLP